MWRHFNVTSNHAVARQLTATNIEFRHEVFIFHKPNWCSLIDNYFRHKTPCGIRKLTAAFVSKIGVFSRFSWLLDFGAKMAEFPLPVLQIWWSRKRVAIQIQLMNIHVSEWKYYCLHLVPKFGDMCDCQNWRLHPTDEGNLYTIGEVRIIFSRMQGVNQHAIPSIIQVGCPTCCYQVCALDHANGGAADLDYGSEHCHRNGAEHPYLAQRL